MAKKNIPNIKDALTLGKKSITPKKIEKDISEIENAAKEIHEEKVVLSEKEEEEYEEMVKKTSIHIPMDLYKKLKVKAFERNITLRKLIINTLNDKFK